MICPTCDGTGESRSYYAGEGRCHRCRGTGEVRVECARCSDMVEELDDHDLCAECAKDRAIEEASEEVDDEQND